MKTFLQYLAEERLSKKDENEFFQFKSMKKQLKDLNGRIHTAAEKAVQTAIGKFCDMCKIDKDKFLKENPKLAGKISNLVTPPKDASFAPVAVLYYPASDTYMMALGMMSGGIMKNLLISVTGIFGQIYRMVKGGGMGLCLVPVKPDIKNGKIEIDSSGTAITQMAMTYLLSDIDCEVVWPVRFGDGKIGKAVIKSLDAVCPAVIDLLGACTFGGASVASRMAKLQKYGIKASSKTVRKTVKTATKKAVSKAAEAKRNGETMSTDEIFELSKSIISKIVKDGLPKDKRDELDSVMSKIPDGVIDQVSELAKNKIKEKRGEKVDKDVKIEDIVSSVISGKLKRKFEEFARKAADGKIRDEEREAAE